MCGKKIATLCSGAALVITGWLPMSTGTLAAITVTGGAALVVGCSPERSDTRQDARTSERTENRVEDRHN